MEDTMTIGIRGYIDCDLSHDELTKRFIDWVESNGWSFCGSTTEATGMTYWLEDEYGKYMEVNE